MNTDSFYDRQFTYQPARGSLALIVSTLQKQRYSLPKSMGDKNFHVHPRTNENGHFIILNGENGRVTFRYFSMEKMGEDGDKVSLIKDSLLEKGVRLE